MRRPHFDPIGWHVFARGARRLELFKDDEDFRQFLGILDYALSASECTLWAYTLMSNHFHLALYGSSDQLTACMRRLDTMYASYHNQKYGLSGHAFDGPYQAYPQPSPLLLLRTVAYIFCNPVDAGLTVRPEDYPWSCVRNYLGLPGSPFEVDPMPLMRHVDSNPKTSWEYFHRALDREMRRPKVKATHRLTMVEVHAQQFAWLLEYATETQAKLGDEDPVQVAIYWARLRGVSPRAMALTLGESYSISQIKNALFRMQSRVATDPGLAARLGVP